MNASVCNTPRMVQPISVKKSGSSGKRLGIGRLKIKYNMFDTDTLKSAALFKDVVKEVPEQEFRQGLFVVLFFYNVK